MTDDKINETESKPVEEDEIYHCDEETDSAETKESEEKAIDDGAGKQSEKPSSFGASVGSGAIGGLVAGLLASSGDGKLGFGAFIAYFFFIVAGVKGGIQMVIASVVFAVVAAVVVAVLKGL